MEGVLGAGAAGFTTADLFCSEIGTMPLIFRPNWVTNTKGDRKAQVFVPFSEQAGFRRQSISHLGAGMDVTRILAELKQEREQIEQAILSLEMLARGRGRKRGRPPAWMSEITAQAPKRRGRPAGSKNKTGPAAAAATKSAAVA